MLRIGEILPTRRVFKYCDINYSCDVKKAFKDYQSLVRNLHTMFDGQVILGEDALDTDSLELKFTIRPNDGMCEQRSIRGCYMTFVTVSQKSGKTYVG